MQEVAQLSQRKVIEAEIQLFGKQTVGKVDVQTIDLIFTHKSR